MEGPVEGLSMGRGPVQRQRAYSEYVCSNRNKEEQEIREKMVRGSNCSNWGGRISGADG
jgi:hypothetical protein